MKIQSLLCNKDSSSCFPFSPFPEVAAESEPCQEWINLKDLESAQLQAAGGGVAAAGKWGHQLWDQGGALVSFS